MFFFFFNDTATTEIYTLSLHDALPISRSEGGDDQGSVSRGSLLSTARVRDSPAAAAGAPGGHPAAPRALRGGARAGGARAASRGDLAGGARALPGLWVAGERPRVAQRGGAGADSL